jgi:K+-transporting ATPase ATPase C chain
MNTILRPAFTLMILSTLVLGLGYPLAITGIAQVVMAGMAGGSLVHQGDVVIGSSLIGQPFASPGYFWPRPSATADSPYNAAASSGTNLGPTSAKLKGMVAAEVKRQRDAGITGSIPADAATYSGSGLDPHISPDYARLQVARIAKARGVKPEEVAALVENSIEGRLFGLIGEPRVNVLAVNLALDRLAPKR